MTTAARMSREKRLSCMGSEFRRRPSRPSRARVGPLHGNLAAALLLGFAAASFATASFAATGGAAEPSRLPRGEPASVGVDGAKLAAIHELVATAIGEKKLPGCVVCIGRRGRVIWLHAYGQRAILPTAEPMTVDTVFDLASLTKPLATGVAVMHCVERGRISLDDKVVVHLPEFAPRGKDELLVRDLLIHQSGLIADNALSDYEQGVEEAWRRICQLKLQSPRGTKFVYSDVNFIVLGKLVERVEGKSLAEVVRERICAPLGLQETGFNPSEALRRRAAPTQQREGRWLRGEVHDPRAAKLAGVAGHAGLFSTAEDLAVYAQSLLAGGAWNDRRILRAETVATMTRGYPVSSGVRGLGWDKRTGYSSNRGAAMTDQAFGHGGFTGTAIWIDPGLDLFVIFLSNRVHPDGKGLVNPLAGRIGQVAADAVLDRPAPPP